MSAKDRRRQDNRARGGAAASFLKHAMTATAEGRAEDALWLRGKAADRWARRRARPEPATAEEVEAVLRTTEDPTARATAMALLTLVRVAEARPETAEALRGRTVALTAEIEHLL